MCLCQLPCNFYAGCFHNPAGDPWVKNCCPWCSLAYHALQDIYSHYKIAIEFDGSQNKCILVRIFRGIEHSKDIQNFLWLAFFQKAFQIKG